MQRWGSGQRKAGASGASCRIAPAGQRRAPCPAGVSVVSSSRPPAAVLPVAWRAGSPGAPPEVSVRWVCGFPSFLLSLALIKLPAQERAGAGVRKGHHRTPCPGLQSHPLDSTGFAEARGACARTLHSPRQHLARRLKNRTAAQGRP